jgi:hypothetical protein
VLGPYGPYVVVRADSGNTAYGEDCSDSLPKKRAESPATVSIAPLVEARVLDKEVV